MFFADIVFGRHCLWPTDFGIEKVGKDSQIKGVSVQREAGWALKKARMV